jgi:hypothetical protein
LIPRGFGAHDGPAEILCIFDHEGQRTHLHPDPFSKLDQEIELLRPASVLAVYADETSVAAFGTNQLSQATRPPAARAGREIGRSRAEVPAFWA